MIYLGIDPGANGGLAAIFDPPPLGESGINLRTLPETRLELWTLISNYRNLGVVAVLEKVGGYIQGNPTPGSTMFNFGEIYGAIHMALIAAGIPFRCVTPQRWQQFFDIPKKGSRTTSQFKNLLKKKAIELFPTSTPTLATADALLIAEYCRRTSGV